jgi:membrane-associated phospholipid phosphatase
VASGGTRRAAVALAAGLVVASAGARSAAEPAPAASLAPESALDIDWRVHVPIVVAGGLGWMASEVLLKDGEGDQRCSWCEGNAFDDGVRSKLRWSRPETAARLSDALVYGVAPASAFGLTALAAVDAGRAAWWPEDAFVVLEATVLAADVAQLVKFQVDRARPYMRETAEAPEPPAEHNLSFYSGHTSFAFSLAVASGTVASMRGYRSAPAVWALGLGAAAATGWMRVAADRHYASDILTGALVGSAIGFVVPYVLHRRRPPKSRKRIEVGLAPAPGGALVLFGWR